LPFRYIQVVACLLLAALSVPVVWSQNPAPKAMPQQPSSTKPEISVVTSVRVVQERGVPALEILSTLPSVPSIQFLNSPPRLVVDLLHARMGLKENKENRIDAPQENILGVRAEQFQADPPIARVVLDLRAPYGYTWDEAGNRLMVRLKPPEDANAAAKKTPRHPLGGVTSPAPSRAVAVVPVTSGAGDVILEQSRIAAGSTLTSGGDTAVLRLSRGGEVRICPGSTVSITPAKNANDLMLGMSAGALETHYALHSSADTVLTPDFRILFAGPGEFDFAISTNSHGDTCVRGLTGNSSSAIVSELIGDRIYQVKPGEQAVFRAGRIDKVDSNVPLDCGCPPAIPVERAEAAVVRDSAANSKPTTSDTQLEVATKPESSDRTKNDQQKLAAETKALSNGAETRPLPPSEPNAVHVQIEAPFVYRAKTRSATPSPTDEAAALPVTTVRSQPAQLEIQVLPPATPPSSTQSNPTPHRFLRRLKGFFSSIFS
jgi:hypothetical protein